MLESEEVEERILMLHVVNWLIKNKIFTIIFSLSKLSNLFTWGLEIFIFVGH